MPQWPRAAATTATFQAGQASSILVTRSRPSLLVSDVMAEHNALQNDEAFDIQAGHVVPFHSRIDGKRTCHPPSSGARVICLSRALEQILGH
jgi:hypothetical protein